MGVLECALADQRWKPQAAAPVLSVVIPNFMRRAELELAVSSIADQLGGGLEDKVEIVVTDNGSDGETVAFTKALADRFAPVSYAIHARDEGGFFNMFAAPWRARGRYTWVFGSDDVVLPGGIAHVVEILEKKAPSFLTLNKAAANADLSQIVWEQANTIPDASFDSFHKLLAHVGINQVAFLSCQIEETEAARAIDAEFYLTDETRHPHIPAFLEKHFGRKSLYSEAAHVVHRLENSTVLDYHAGNFFDYGVTLPLLLWKVMQKVGAPNDLPERITGHKRIDRGAAPGLTFVDSMFENMLRASHYGLYVTAAQRRGIDAMLRHARADRVAQFDQIWAFTQELSGMERRAKALQGELTAARNTAMQASVQFTQPTG